MMSEERLDISLLDASKLCAIYRPHVLVKTKTMSVTMLRKFRTSEAAVIASKEDYALVQHAARRDGLWLEVYVHEGRNIHRHSYLSVLGENVSCSE